LSRRSTETGEWSRQEMRLPGYVTLALVFTMGLTSQSDAQVYKIRPIGHVVKNAGKVKLEILSQYKDALLGLNEFSHVLVFYWFERVLRKRGIGRMAGNRRMFLRESSERLIFMTFPAPL
jgi:tRNA (Thr-GGU) A37 N-methylase